ncbi:MAG: hypothetical protein KAR79_01950 [Simkaniaceae bacterium]|nr:hypothetical protein [Simkaniaceae bacterium]
MAIPGAVPHTPTQNQFELKHQINASELEQFLPALLKVINDKKKEDIPSLSDRLIVFIDPKNGQASLELSKREGSDETSEMNRILLILNAHISEKFINKSENGTEQVIQFQKNKDSRIEVLFKSTDSHTLDSIISNINTSGTPKLPLPKTTAESYCGIM